MRGLIQLVTHAEVKVADKVIASINHGILVLVGIEKSDSEQSAIKLFDRLINYRIFPDNEGKMNLSLKSVEGSVLLVPQFTLVAETSKGTRPGFSVGMEPEAGKSLFEFMAKHAKANYPYVQAGEFGAYMQVSLCNDGPVTFLLEVK